MSNGPSAPDAGAAVELAKRLLTHVPGGPSVEVVVGGLPPGLTVELPLPAGGRLLGSVLRSRGSGPMYLEAVFDASGDPAQVVAVYEKELKASGWETVESWPGSMRGGFVPGPTAEGMSFRLAGQGPMLLVAAIADENNSVDVRVRLDWEMPKHLDDSRRLQFRPPGAERIPDLHPPAGVSLESRGGGGGGDRWHSEAIVHTERSVVELEAHFAAQLVAAGWARLEGRADNVVGWSSWRLPGENEWRGLLLVLAAFGSRQRSLWLGVETTASDGGDGGGFTSTMAFGN